MPVASLSDEDIFLIHQIAYLTQRGWSFMMDGECYKEGFTRQIEMSHPCGCCTYNKDTKHFNIDEAYWEQLEIDEKPNGA